MEDGVEALSDAPPTDIGNDEVSCDVAFQSSDSSSSDVSVHTDITCA